ncbi:MAG TPA: DinB family protein [Candidatus Acidoferrales bacterium]|nr:DinB family protein [Candidatus Acidoferrales bacterium]
MTKVIAFLIGAGAGLYAQTAPMTVARLYDSQLKNTEGEVVSLAEAMPESKYGFRPANGEFAKVRTFAEQIKHIAAVNYLVSASVLGEKPPVNLGTGENGPDEVKSKDAVVKFLKDSFAYAHKAMQSLTDKNQLDMIKGPFGNEKSARAGLANVAVWHPFDHYGQMVVYARMNGVVPPASR